MFNQTNLFQFASNNLFRWVDARAVYERIIILSNRIVLDYKLYKPNLASTTEGKDIDMQLTI